MAGTFYANDHRMMKTRQPGKAQSRRSGRGGSTRSLVQRRLTSGVPMAGVPVVFDFTDRGEALRIAFEVADLCRLSEGVGEIPLACPRKFDCHIIARQYDTAAINCWRRVISGTAACQDECEDDRSCSHASISIDEKSRFKLYCGREKRTPAPHPKSDIRRKKPLSYMAPLCQPSFRLSRQADKGGHGLRIRTRPIGGSTRLNFTELCNDDADPALDNRSRQGQQAPQSRLARRMP